MIARNFLETNSNILYPRIDMDGAGTGIIGSEFPLFNYLIFMLAKIFGYTHWYGRLINLAVSSAGVFFFHALLRRFVNERIAITSSLILLCSVWFAYSRKSMPDTFSVSLTIMGVYFGLLYLYETKFLHLILYLILSTLGVLCKIPSLFLLSIFATALFDSRISNTIKLYFISASLIVIGVVSVWYFYWVPTLIERYHYPLYFPRHLKQGLRELITNGKETFEKFYFSSLRSYFAFLAFLSGIALLMKKKEKILLSVLLITSAFFLMFMLKAGEVFSLHGYYIVPFTPVMALCAGYAIAEIKNQKWFIAMLLLIGVEAAFNQHHDFRIKESEKYKLRLENIADNICNKNSLIGINGGDNPQQIYFTHRKGWTFADEKSGDKKFIDSLKQKGCKFIFINKIISADGYEINGSTVFEDESFKVFRLD
jgi:4-amino-4-deoxy-L-arabinose transferase-like glycosyltransferase